jgi:CO dehydrogenase maturation factor
MRIAFVGKGGSGKTTLAGIFIEHLNNGNKNVVAFDADINQQLGRTIGITKKKISKTKSLGQLEGEIKTHLMGENKRISSIKTLTRTTPPGPGSNLIKCSFNDPIIKKGIKHGGITFLRVGDFSEHDIGKACFHAKIIILEIILNHLADTEKDFIIFDMTAGADIFSSAIFSKFDLLCIVVEPTIKSVEVYEQFKRYAKKFNIKIGVIGNKIHCNKDIRFLKEKIKKEHLLGMISHSEFVMSREREEKTPFEMIEEENKKQLKKICDKMSKLKMNRKKMMEINNKIHREESLRWLNKKFGEDLTRQIF